MHDLKKSDCIEFQAIRNLTAVENMRCGGSATFVLGGCCAVPFNACPSFRRGLRPIERCHVGHLEEFDWNARTAKGGYTNEKVKPPGCW
jgi:hypothetical protein